MCMRSSAPSVPAPPPPPPEPPEAPRKVDANVQQARTDERRQARLAAGRSGTIMTDSDLESAAPNTAQRTLLG